MGNITQHQSTKTTKLLLIGDSGSGKTGALAALAASGYKLRILDLDNGLDILKNYLVDPKSPYVKACSTAAENVEFETITDPMKAIQGKLYPRRATVWDKVINATMHWKFTQKDGTITDLGKPSSWDPTDTIFVLDSLTKLGEAALNFHLQLNGKLGENRTQNEHRRDVNCAQDLLRDWMTTIYDDNFLSNVIVISHIQMVSPYGAPKVEEGQLAQSAPTPIGYPNAIGRALSPHIPRWFNSMLIAKVSGHGSSRKHKLCTGTQIVGDQIVSAKNSAPLKVLPEYDLDWGLAKFFEAVRG